MEITLENLSKKYNLGVQLDVSERFYTGNNRNKIWAWARESGMVNPYSFYAKEIKRIVKKEFGMNVKARSSHYRRVDVIIERTKDELFKKFEELTDAERQDLYRCIHWFCRDLDGISEETAKLYYEKIQVNDGVNRSFLKDEYKLLDKFINLLMKSWNYDHTGSFMGDCDYDDADFYGFVRFEAIDVPECNSDTEFGKFYVRTRCAKTDAELRGMLNSANVL